MQPQFWTKDILNASKELKLIIWEHSEYTHVNTQHVKQGHQVLILTLH